jgi:hypothetical protein
MIPSGKTNLNIPLLITVLEEWIIEHRLILEANKSLGNVTIFLALDIKITNAQMQLSLLKREL